MDIETKKVRLVLQSPDQVRAMIDAMPPSERREVSAEWLARISASASPDPWLHGFTRLDRESGTAVGNGLFKGPPDADGAVEISYGVAPEYRGQGYATEAASALTEFAFRNAQVRVVRAYTRPEPNPSTSVLTKCGFRKTRAVVDPEDV